MSFSLSQYLESKRLKVEKGLRDVFKKPGDCPKALWESMKYSIFAGGKRLRCQSFYLEGRQHVGDAGRDSFERSCGTSYIATDAGDTRAIAVGIPADRV